MSFPFPPLLGQDTIRLFRLTHAADEEIPLTGELFEYSLRDSSTLHLYEALSYTWGSEDTPKSAIVNDNVFAITANLESALLRLRNHTLDRVMWIDAICINQEDDAEKQQQIPHMADIYRKASRVIVDLGSATVEDQEALEIIRLAASGRKLVLEDDEVTILNVLLERPYFARTWVSVIIDFLL
jgi:Heterokaryon incompatibility protein (HET)